MEWNEFRQACLDAGFVSTSAVDPLHPLQYGLGTYIDENEEAIEIRILFQIENGSGHFVFNSGLGNEFIHLNSLDPVKVIEWGKMIASIEPNY